MEDNSTSVSDSMFPNDYIPQENQRLARMYKRVAGVENPQALSEVAGELRDRYGEPPSAVRESVTVRDTEDCVSAGWSYADRAAARSHQYSL